MHLPGTSTPTSWGVSGSGKIALTDGADLAFSSTEGLATACGTRHLNIGRGILSKAIIGLRTAIVTDDAVPKSSIGSSPCKDERMLSICNACDYGCN